MIYYLSKIFPYSETHYSHVEKLGLSTVIDLQTNCRYILLCTTIFLAYQNPMYYILNFQILGVKYSCWILILHEFDLEFAKATSKKSLVFMELMCDLPCALMEVEPNDSFPDDFLFLISTTNPWYGYLIIYL